jgi:adenylate kinase family enzyme
MGNNFTGKKTQAKLLSEHYSLKIYNIDEFTQKYFDIIDKLSIPIEETPNYKSLRRYEIEKIISDRKEEEKMIEPYKNILLNLRSILNNSKSSFQREEAMVDFIIELIKIDFPEQSNSHYIEEIRIRNKRIKDIEEEIKNVIIEKSNKKPKIPVKNEETLLKEKNKIISESNKGFILLDFPKTAYQAKILEKKITGYTTELEKVEAENIKIKYHLTSLCDSSNKIPPKKNLTESGFNLMIYLEGNPKECLRRSQNRKLDPLTGIIYHMEDNPFPSEDRKITERLINCDNFTPKLPEILENIRKHNLEISGIFDFLSRFGIEKINLKTLNKLKIYQRSEHNMDYKQQISTLNKDLNNLITKIVKLNVLKENEFLSKQYNLMNSDRGNHFGNNNNNQNNINVIPSVKSSMISDSQNEIIMEVTQSENKSMSVKDKENASDSISINREKISYLGTEMNVNIKANKIINDGTDIYCKVQNLDEDDFNRYNKKLNEAKKKLNNTIIDEIYTKWNKTSENYRCNLYTIFKKIKNQKESLLTNYSRLQDMFIDFLKRPSEKNVELNKFIAKYNKFLDEYPDLGYDNIFKYEFKQDLKDISDRIWEHIEFRKIEAIEERKKIISIGFIDKEMHRFYINVEKLFFCEAKKFEISLSIIRQFYSTLDSKSFIELSSFKAEIILKEELDTITSLNNMKNINKDEIELRISFLKLDKLFRNSIRMIILYDEYLKLQENKSKLTNNNISLDVSNIKKSFNYKAKKTIQETTFLEDKKEIFIYEEELKNAIKAEKDKFKYRVIFIKNWAKNVLLNMKKVSNLVYENLDAWIIKSIKAENDSMNNLLSYFETSIENVQKVKLDMELDSFDIYDFIKVEEYLDGKIVIKLN